MNQLKVFKKSIIINEQDSTGEIVCVLLSLNNIYVGLKNGYIVRYSIKKTNPYTKDFSVTLAYNKKIGRKSVIDMCIIENYNMLLVLCDKKLYAYDANTLQLLTGVLPSNLPKDIFKFVVDKQFPFKLAVVLNKKRIISLYVFNQKDMKYEFWKNLGLPDNGNRLTCINWHAHSLCIAYEKDNIY